MMSVVGDLELLALLWREQLKESVHLRDGRIAQSTA